MNDGGIQWWEQKGRWEAEEWRKRDLRRLTRMAFEDWERGGLRAHEQAKVLGLGIELGLHMLEVHKRLTSKYRRK